MPVVHAEFHQERMLEGPFFDSEHALYNIQLLRDIGRRLLSGDVIYSLVISENISFGRGQRTSRPSTCHRLVARRGGMVESN